MINYLRFLPLVGFLICSSLGAAEPPVFPNAGFEDGTTGWTISQSDAAIGLSKVSPEAAHTGKFGLRVQQEDGGPGSWCETNKIPLETGKACSLNFWARCLQPSGVGIWVRYFDSNRKDIPGSGQSFVVPPNAHDWVKYTMAIKPPEGAAVMAIAVHCYSKKTCLADFDDFSLMPREGGPVEEATPPAKAAFTPLPPVDPIRIKEIASSLDTAPQGIGPSLDDRKAWDSLGADSAFRSKMLERAERYSRAPTPEISNALWLESARTKNRKADALIDSRRNRLASFVMAEGIENQGRFFPFIEKEIAAICSEPTWVLPYLDTRSQSFNGPDRILDLGVAMTAWSLATADSMLGARLHAKIRQSIREAAWWHAFVPYLEKTRGKDRPEWWRQDNYNWNAVVHAGVVGAALALDDSIQERAEIIASTEQEITFYLQGFPRDGYSSEGIGYWKYGFGHYIMLAEAVLKSTHGKVNFYANKTARQIAQFPRRFELAPGIYPAFADAPFMEEPSRWLFHIIDHRYGLVDPEPRSTKVDGMFGTFLYAYGTNMIFDSGARSLYTDGNDLPRDHQLRDWFDQSQVFIGRLPKGQEGITLAFKGGRNGLSHGHNDLGSFVVVAGRQPLLVDPGSTNYDATTFGSKRFDNEILNSFGHSVPRVAGQLQGTGTEHCATIVKTDFSDKEDRIILDLTKAYDVPSLRRLTRLFDYGRLDHGSVTVTDQVEYSSPQAFEVGLVTFGEARQQAPGVWLVSQSNQTLKVEIDAGGLAFGVSDELLKNEARAGKVRRLAISLNSPAEKAAITIRLTRISQ